MNYEAEIQKLNERIAKLEAIEHKRQMKKKIIIVSKLLAVLIILILLAVGYIYVNNKYIKPYKEKIDYIDEKVDSVKSIIDNDTWESLKKYNPFN